MKKLVQLFIHRPEAIVAHSFSFLVILGAVLLKTPYATVKPLSWIDAFFMSASASCVTGLCVIDIGSHLTLFGQLVILSLVQIGGLGIMTFSLFFFMALGKNASLKSRMSVASVSNLAQDFDFRNLRFALAAVLGMTMLCEGAGALLLFMKFKAIHSFWFAVYSAIFHSVCAFCNAGFGLYPDNLMRFQGEILVPCVIMGLIILGGLGFVVINELFFDITGRYARRHKNRLSLHSKIALVGTVSLILVGALLVWVFEAGHSMADMSVKAQIVNSFFLSVTARTAGFNTINIGALTNATLFFVVILMFIGACTGSTGGGIKVSTFMVIAAHVRSKIKGLSMASLFRRKIPDDTIDKALAIFGAAFIAVCFATLVLQLSEQWGLVYRSSRSFLEIMFEAVSAFGTVGLSTGHTAEFSVLGKVVLILLMFVGRVGPLTLGVALQARKRSEVKYEFAEEDVLIG